MQKGANTLTVCPSPGLLQTACLHSPATGQSYPGVFKVCQMVCVVSIWLFRGSIRLANGTSDQLRCDAHVAGQVDRDEAQG
jgi:hypothetical protein